MIDMDVVNREIEAGRAELAASSKAILSLATRTRIWRAMLDPQDDETSYRHRIELKMACVRHVQHFWDSAFPGDNRVEEMLTLAQELWLELNKMAFWGGCCGIPGWRLRRVWYKIVSCRST